MDERAGQGKKRPAGKDKKVDLDNLKREMEMVRASPFYFALSPQRGEFHKIHDCYYRSSQISSARV